MERRLLFRWPGNEPDDNAIDPFRLHMLDGPLPEKANPMFAPATRFTVVSIDEENMWASLEKEAGGIQRKMQNLLKALEESDREELKICNDPKDQSQDDAHALWEIEVSRNIIEAEMQELRNRLEEVKLLQKILRI